MVRLRLNAGVGSVPLSPLLLWLLLLLALLVQGGLSWLDASDTSNLLQVNFGYVALLGGAVLLTRCRLHFVVYGLALLLALNWAISLVSHYYYDSSFSTAFALSVISTNMGEATAMAGMFLPGFVALAVLLFLSVCSLIFVGKKLAPSGMACALSAVLVVAYLAYLGWTGVKPPSLTQVSNTKTELIKRGPFYNAQYFLAARVQEGYFSALKKISYPHRLSAFSRVAAAEISTTEINIPEMHANGINDMGPGVKNLVLVIGESAIRRKMNLYGALRANTPFAQAEKSRMTLFTQAVAPAAYTLMAVPLSLTTAGTDVKPESMEKLADSILPIVAAQQINTHWISSQGHSGQYDTRVSMLAHQAQHTIWVDGPDENVLPAFDQSLAPAAGAGSTQRKLIVLHIMGSHEPMCQYVPKQQQRLHGKDAEEDCYDNSVLYTDWLLGKLFERLKGTDSALLYYSDHALIKNRGKYLHAPGVPTKMAVEVPMFIWYADPARKISPAVISQPYSTVDNFYLIASLLGLTVDGQNCKSVLSNCYTFQPPVVLDTAGKRYNYSALAD